MQQTNTSAYLIIQLGSRWTDVLRLQTDQSIYIGRASECAVVVRDARVSRKHAAVSPTNGGWSVADLGSRNGTQVGGKSLSAPHLLQEGDIISVGGCEMKFTLSLAAGFASENRPADRQSKFDDQATSPHADYRPQATPTIVERLASSKWSSSSITTSPSLAVERSLPSRNRSNDAWNFFYRLVFDLVACDSPEVAAQVALDRLLEELQLSSGGIVTIEPLETARDISPDDISADMEGAGSQVAEKNGSGRMNTSDPLTSILPLPAMAVLAARQGVGATYHRVSDFLVQTVISERRAVLARNVQDDSQLSFARESGRRETVSIICAPLRERLQDQEQVLGLLHVYSTGDERTLTNADLELAVGVADNLSIALSRHRADERRSQDLQQTRRRLDQLEEQSEFSSELVGHSRAMRSVAKAIQRVAPTSATVLIRGESGVGKELVARAMHRQSKRAQGPFVCLNCAALAPTLLESELFGHEKGAFTGATDRKIGKFEAADGGTLLLDEIGEMIPELQAKFLRVLEGESFERLGGNKPIRTDVRVIAATNRNLEEAVEAKLFRADLYFRLRVIEIVIPPLRDRLEDIPELVEFFFQKLKHHASRKLSGVEPSALEMLCRYRWPGNIRELRNVIERAVVLGGNSTISLDDLSLAPLAPPPNTADENIKLISAAHEMASAAFQPLPLAELERIHIFATLDHVDGNKSKASQLLGIERSTLDRKLKRYGEAD